MPVNQSKTLGNDDQSAWALAALTAAEVGLPKPQNTDWLTFARNVFEEQVLRWQAEEQNRTCGGGLRWQTALVNAGYSYKSTSSNANFFLLTARLAKFTGNGTYTQWAEKSFSWARDIGLVSADFAVYDGANANMNCSVNSPIQWTSNLGVYTEGAALMYNITNRTQNWTDAVKGFVNHSSVLQNHSVLVEIACENNGNCDVGQKAYKGIAVRSLARATLFAPIVATPIAQMLNALAKGAASAWSQASGDLSCNFSWIGKSSYSSKNAESGNLAEVFNALEVVQSLLWLQPNASSTGNSQGTKHTSGADKVMTSIRIAMISIFTMMLSL